MISTKDLMIKNLILADFNGKGDTRECEVMMVCESGAVGLIDTARPMRGIDEHHDKHLYGIPLTESWLKRFHFEKVTTEFDGETIEYYLKNIPCIGDLISDEDETGALYLHDGNDEKMVLNFVHELQNLCNVLKVDL